MSALNARFEAAVAASKTLKVRPDNNTLLQLYALYKQGTVGDVEGKRPGFTDMVGRAKYDAWANIRDKQGGGDEAVHRAGRFAQGLDPPQLPGELATPAALRRILLDSFTLPSRSGPLAISLGPVRE